ncbi:lysophospholipid acyltransferase family protein [Nonomuraea gerenzanensis]|uniref:1-acyl-sn-glycerol-3-phosphate acyltransferase n=1 Tax=Nonomuraea gerenzanensis TaxID=93944 RepID=A0A1M4EFB6_9ACTN|nr:lysophospholipid acyltransferase family protein [Nonomuraea gerenzanensis]UBU09023.1 1-acyl-sn-glycerol-3-phosphate acyltransferase [Nonomuraea gerenzanensis]SBO97406.1 1-acyl-sn-glycerol-3-phosphate acyltransferase [Nonomuraea gerenzanensis]
MSTVLPPPAAQLNPWRPMGPCTPAACIGDPASAVGRVRRTGRVLAVAAVVLGGVPVALAARLFTRAHVTRLWARLMLRALGLRLEVRGAIEADGAGALVVANHVSWLDPLVIAATVPSRPLAKREVAGWPVVRTLVAGAGALFIDRERLMALPSAVAAVADALSAGDTVVAFPEGTTWCGRGMGGFRPAVFQAAIDAGAVVRPATLRYREGPLPSTRACFVGDDSLLASLLRVTATRDLVVEVTLLAPVRPAPGAGGPRARAELARISEARVRAGVPGPHLRGEGV